MVHGGEPARTQWLVGKVGRITIMRIPLLKVGVVQNKTTWKGSMAIATPILANPTVSNCEGWPHKQRMKDVTKKLVEIKAQGNNSI